MEPNKTGPPRYDEVIDVGKTENGLQTQAVYRPQPVLVHGSAPVYQPTPTPSAPAENFTVSLNVRTTLNVVNTLTHFFLGMVVFSAFVVANQNHNNGWWWSRRSLSQHVYLCVIGYVILMTQAVLSFSPHGGWAYNLQYPHKRRIHAAMQVVGSILALIGCIIKIADWGYYPMTNLGHAILGWIAMLLTFLSLIGGLINYKCAVRMKEGRWKKLKTGHSYLGIVILFTVYLSICFVFAESYYFPDYTSSILAVIFTVFAMIGVLVMGVTSKIIEE